MRDAEAGRVLASLAGDGGGAEGDGGVVALVLGLERWEGGGEVVGFSVGVVAGMLVLEGWYVMVWAG